MGKDISYLNKSNILAGKLIDLVPELYDLQNIIEDNDWHPEESVFDHTLSVLANLEKTFLVLHGKIKKGLNQKIDNNTKKILLKIAAILHDVGKKETVVLTNGTTDAPGHEIVSAEKTENILRRFNLSNQEVKYVKDIVANHMTFHKILDPENATFQKDFVIFKNRFSNTIYPELVLLAFADTVGSYLRKSKPKEFRHRTDFYKREIEKLS